MESSEDEIDPVEWQKQQTELQKKKTRRMTTVVKSKLDMDVKRDSIIRTQTKETETWNTLKMRETAIPIP